MKITIKEKSLELKPGILNVYYSKEFQNSFYSQFSNERIFGCNFSDGSMFHGNKNDTNVFSLDYKALSFFQRVSYFNRCFNFTGKTDTDVEIHYNTDGNVVTGYLFSKFLEYKYDKTHLIISNMYDTHLGTMEKMIYMKKLQELVSAGFTVVMLTNDLILFKLLDIDINLFIENIKEVDTIDQLIENYDNTTEFYKILSKCN